MTAVLGIGPNCFVPERVPVKIGMGGPVVGYADGFREDGDKVYGTIHIEDRVIRDRILAACMRTVGLSHCVSGEPEVMDEIAFLDL